ncbi:CDC48 family AAA ATPase [Methylacidimicrobium tartarophylax]|uniref:Cell division protease FtsH n=1 Tax=Methylacidimicrobium tartarophylax TaxID=1041768 RepID=A0A5E6MAD3_9BACT|nr:CDC48 family AAA ATPase [Methylacidimicrobium tartarophylax]VVM05298.1 cell division protease FtsH [Methylacidimicrobium tartarophylax]
MKGFEKLAKLCRRNGGRNGALRAGALPLQEEGKGLCRLGMEQMRSLSLQPGAVVAIDGPRRTVGVAVLREGSEEAERGIVQIDPILRGNAGIGLGEKVSLSKIVAGVARRLTLTPIPSAWVPRGQQERRELLRQVEGRPLLVGDRVRITVAGKRRDFLVAQTEPDGPVVVSGSTELRVEADRDRESGSRGISYEDVGGLHREMQRVREMVELPLRHPELFERFGIGAPKGILLHGPPGSGKTLIARTVAAMTKASFFPVSGPEILDKHYGEAEARLRRIFEEAEKKAPSIIFFDEIDALAPKRETVVGEMEKRVVGQLLSLMDGLRARGQVVVLGATNLPNLLDPALRRPGRFDREIMIGIPDRNGRLEILRIHSRRMPLAEDVELEELADLTHGYLGADLELLCREAAMASLREFLALGSNDGAGTVTGEGSREEVTRAHFLEALRQVEPSALREVMAEVPDVHWGDIGGLDDVKRELQEALAWPLLHAQLFKHAGAKPAKGILLHGPPGTGKTLLAKAAATESKANFIGIKGPALISKWVGESERGVREIFRRARGAAPCIVFLDEIDALAPSRGASGDSRVMERVVGALLTELDGMEELRGVVVLGATNRIDIIDPALLRPGRFDLIIPLMLPDLRERREILKVHLRGKPVASDIDLEALAAQTEGCSGAQIEAVCLKGTMLAIREYLEANGEATVDPVFRDYRLRMAHLEEAVHFVSRSRPFVVAPGEVSAISPPP